MFCRKINKIFLVFFCLLLPLFFNQNIFCVHKENISEKILIENILQEQNKRKKLKKTKQLFNYYVNINNYDKVILVSKYLLKFNLSKKYKYFVYYNLARAYKNNKKNEYAVEAAQEAEYIYPNKIDIKMLMGEIYFDNSLYELAVTKFKQVIELDNNHVTAAVNLGNIYKRQENYKTALLYYCKAINLRKNLPVQVYIDTAVSYKETGNSEKAISILKDIREENKTAALILADIYKNKNDFVSAKKELEPYVYKKDVDTEIYCKLGEILLLAGDYENAKKLMLYYKYKSKNKNVEAIDFLLAEACYMSGEKEKTLKIINNILYYTKSDYIKEIIHRTFYCAHSLIG